MATTFIEMKDGVIVEVGDPLDRRTEMSVGMADRIDTTMDLVSDTLHKIITPLARAFSGFGDETGVPSKLESGEVQFALCFSVEGSVFVAKSSGGGNFGVKVTFRPSEGVEGDTPEKNQPLD